MLSMTLVLAFLLTLVFSVPTSQNALASPSGGVIDVVTTTTTIRHGETFEVSIDLSDNPGFAGMGLKVSFPEGLEATHILMGSTSMESNERDFLNEGISRPDGYSSLTGELSPAAKDDFYVIWGRSNNYSLSGTLFRVEFKVTEDAIVGPNVISITFGAGGGGSGSGDPVYIPGSGETNAPADITIGNFATVNIVGDIEWTLPAGATSSSIYGATGATETVTITNTSGVQLNSVSYDVNVDSGSGNYFTIAPTFSFMLIPNIPANITVTAVNNPPAGEYTLSFTITYDNGNKSVTSPPLTWTVEQAPLIIDSAVVDPKVYDGGTTATVTSVVFSGLKNGEQLDIDDDYTVSNAVFDDKHVGGTKTVTGTVTLTPTNANLARNYVLSDGDLTTTTGEIAALPLEIEIEVDEKVYDGTNAATVTFFPKNLVSGDSIEITGTAAFEDENVDDDKNVTITDINIGGPDGGN